MKIMSSCPVCLQEGIANGDVLTIIGSLSEAELRNDGKYDVTCSRGHKSITLLQQHKFEILYEMGANAILDGYYVEAVAAFKASLERFYEFFIRVSLFERNIPQDVIEDSWKYVRKSSERQLGGFVFLYAQRFGKKPALLADKWDSFRNDVIHSGLIPSKDKTIEFGQAVLDVIRPLIKETNDAFKKIIWDVVVNNLDAQKGTDNDVIPMATTGMVMILTQTPEQHGRDKRTLLESLAGLQEQRKLMPSIEDAKKLLSGRTSVVAD